MASAFLLAISLYLGSVSCPSACVSLWDLVQTLTMGGDGRGLTCLSDAFIVIGTQLLKYINKTLCRLCGDDVCRNGQLQMKFPPLWEWSDVL